MGESHDPEKGLPPSLFFVVFSWPCVNDMKLANDRLFWLCVCCRFNDPAVRDKVTRVVLLWVNNHFTDFETDPAMMDFLETFESLLEQSKMLSHVSPLNHV
jgi:hypothetical protein